MKILTMSVISLSILHEMTSKVNSKFPDSRYKPSGRTDQEMNNVLYILLPLLTNQTHHVTTLHT